jgi:hypothetical protein
MLGRITRTGRHGLPAGREQTGDGTLHALALDDAIAMMLRSTD